MHFSHCGNQLHGLGWPTTENCNILESVMLGGEGVSESMDGQGCAILALEVVPKNLIFGQKSYPKIYFTRFYACYFSKENYASLIYQVKMATSLWQDAKIN